MASPSERAIKSHKEKPQLAGKAIIIAGAGIGGLSFAIALLKQLPSTHQKPKITVFERDNREDRLGREGYTLSIRSDDQSGGVQVLEKLGLYEDARAVSVKGGEAGSFFIWDKNWNELLKIRSIPVGAKGLTSMRIRRNALQRILADEAVKCGADIRWETEVVGASSTKRGKIGVLLKDNSVIDCDLLIAADGSNSKLRTNLKPGEGLNFANVVCLSGTARYESEELVPKPVDQDWGALLGGGGIGLFVAPVDSKSALWSFSYHAQQRETPQRYPMSDANIEKLLGHARSLAKHFPPKVEHLVEATDPSTLMLFNAMDRPPFSHSVTRDGAVVWIGDANHAVSPFAGNGANMALMDGWDLARCLSKATALDDALKQYDMMFIPRAWRTLQMSHQSISIAHADGVKLWFYVVFLRVVNLFLKWGKS